MEPRRLIFFRTKWIILIGAVVLLLLAIWMAIRPIFWKGWVALDVTSAKVIHTTDPSSSKKHKVIIKWTLESVSSGVMVSETKDHQPSVEIVKFEGGIYGGPNLSKPNYNTFALEKGVIHKGISSVYVDSFDAQNKMIGYISINRKMSTWESFLVDSFKGNQFGAALRTHFTRVGPHMNRHAGSFPFRIEDGDKLVLED